MALNASPTRITSVVFLLTASACGAGNTDDLTGGSSSSTGFTEGGGGEGFGGMGSCASIDQEAVSRPLNLYIMLDRSNSMVGDKWEAAVAGLHAFLEDPASDGINIAFRSFPEGAPGCDQTFYREPAVGWAELPGIAQEAGDALDALAPDGMSTPVYQALGGAILECIEMKENHPDEEAAALLVTDGAPQGPAGMCGGVDPEAAQTIADLAGTGKSFGVTTFVIGLPGVDQAFANLVAESGGSGEAIVVATTNVETQFREALAKVRGDLLPCEYLIPSEVTSGEIGITYVNLAIGSEGQEPELISQDPNCEGPGWHYDDQVPPTTIILCPETCDSISSDTTATIQIRLGCSTVVK